MDESGSDDDDLYENDDEKEFVLQSTEAMAVHARKHDDLIVFVFANDSSKKLCCNETDVPLKNHPDDDWQELQDILLKDYPINLTNGLSKFSLLNTDASNVALKSIGRGSQWHFAIERWRGEAGTRWKKHMEGAFARLMDKIDKDDPEDQEGTRGLWELSTRADCLSFFTDDVLASLADTLDESEQEQVHQWATGAIWCLCRMAWLRDKLWPAAASIIKLVLNAKAAADDDDGDAADMGRRLPLEQLTMQHMAGCMAAFVHSPDAVGHVSSPKGMAALMLLIEEHKVEAAEALANAVAMRPERVSIMAEDDNNHASFTKILKMATQRKDPEMAICGSSLLSVIGRDHAKGGLGRDKEGRLSVEHGGGGGGIMILGKVGTVSSLLTIIKRAYAYRPVEKKPVQIPPLQLPQQEQPVVEQPAVPKQSGGGEGGEGEGGKGARGEDAEESAVSMGGQQDEDDEQHLCMHFETNSLFWERTLELALCTLHGWSFAAADLAQGRPGWIFEAQEVLSNQAAEAKAAHASVLDDNDDEDDNVYKFEWDLGGVLLKPSLKAEDVALLCEIMLSAKEKKQKPKGPKVAYAISNTIACVAHTSWGAPLLIDEPDMTRLLKAMLASKPVRMRSDAALIVAGLALEEENRVKMRPLRLLEMLTNTLNSSSGKAGNRSKLLQNHVCAALALLTWTEKGALPVYELQLEQMVALLTTGNLSTLHFVAVMLWNLAHNRDNRRRLNTMGVPALITGWVVALMHAHMGGSEEEQEPEQQQQQEQEQEEPVQAAKEVEGSSARRGSKEGRKGSKEGADSSEGEEVRERLVKSTSRKGGFKLKAVHKQLGLLKEGMPGAPTFSELLEFLVGCLWLLSYDSCGQRMMVDPATGTLHAALDLLRSCRDPANAKAMEYSINLVWILCNDPKVLTQSIRRGLLLSLLDIGNRVDEYGKPVFPSRTRLTACRQLQYLIKHPAALADREGSMVAIEQLVTEQPTLASIESAIILLLKGSVHTAADGAFDGSAISMDELSAREYAASVLMRIAASSSRKLDITFLGGLEALLQAAKGAFRELELHGELPMAEGESEVEGEDGERIDGEGSKMATGTAGSGSMTPPTRNPTRNRRRSFFSEPVGPVVEGSEIPFDANVIDRQRSGSVFSRRGSVCSVQSAETQERKASIKDMTVLTRAAGAAEAAVEEGGEEGEAEEGGEGEGGGGGGRGRRRKRSLIPMVGSTVRRQWLLLPPA
jgi:hypothetical protein